MHDINTIVADREGFDRALCRRGLPPQAMDLIGIDAARRAAVTEENEARAQVNEISKRIGLHMRNGNADEAAAAVEEARRIREAVPRLRRAVDELEIRLKQHLAHLPNLPAVDVPDGVDETGNVFLRESDDEPQAFQGDREHWQIGEALGLMDFARATKISGPRFVVLRGQFARLSRALGQFMIDLHTQQHGYCEIEAPLIANRKALFGTGQLPKFSDDLYRLAQDDDETADAAKFLIPTAEVSLTNLVANEILDRADLPLRYTALTPCFRSEAGAAGKDTRGMLRQHQFMKCELVSIVEPDKSVEEHQRMLENAEAVLKMLGLPYRIMTLCAGDLGFSANKTYDIEVWLPGQKTYREISSVSNCGAFQARRMNARMRGSDGKTIPVHTLNGSGVAVGRALIAIIENFQCADDSVEVPACLRPYMGGLRQIMASPR